MSFDTTVLYSRLIEAGVPPSCIQLKADCDEIPVLGDNSLVVNEQDVPKTKKNDDVTTDPVVVDIKTLVWEGNGRDSQSPNEDNTSKDDSTFYIVTALLLNNKVDVGLLQDVVCKHRGLARCTLALAPVQQAESLTGYRSGCMPPILHHTALQLYVEASITPTIDAPIPMTVMATCGSGILGQSLLLPLQYFMSVVVAAGTHSIHHNPHLVAPFIQSTTRTLSSLLLLEADTSVDASTIAHTKMEDNKPGRKNRHFKEPKDRIGAYRSFESIAEKAQILRSTARNRDKFLDVQALVEEALKTEGEFPLLMQTNAENGNKNALHAAAWRGDIKTVQLLVETGTVHYLDLDVVNLVSLGFKTHGKTPIFYALTQRREDVVRYLLSQGCNLLIVNTKAQTPCSLAATHLEKECYEDMFEMERQQLAAGGIFADYRVNYSDNLFYSDLDPRFPIDYSNLEADVGETLEQYRASLLQAPCETIYNGIPTVFLPRSLQPTTRWRNRIDKSSELFPTTRIDAPTDFREEAANAKEEKKHKKLQPMEDMLPKPIDMKTLDLLQIEDVLVPTTVDDEIKDQASILVDSIDTIQQLEAEILVSFEYASNVEFNDGMTADEIVVNSAWGMDCEWKPGADFGLANPVATLQLSTRRCSFLVDVQTICQSLDRTTNSVHAQLHTMVLTDTESQLSRVLEKLFWATELPLLGFGVLQDLEKLAASFPHIPCFALYHSVVDLQSIVGVTYPTKASGGPKDMSSLQKMGAVLLEKRIDKEQQCSDWMVRPLSKEQFDYAILDAAVLPLLLEKMLAQTLLVDKYEGQFFQIHSELRSSLRYTLLEEVEAKPVDGQDFTYEVPMGRIRKALSITMGRQSWCTDHSPPELPKRVPLIRRENTGDHNLASTGMSKKERAKRGKAERQRSKPIPLHSLPANLHRLPPAGSSQGYTKDACAHSVIGLDVINALPEDVYLGFNRRTTIVELQNAWMIFCNFYWGYASTKYCEFLEGGTKFRFRLDPKKHINNGKSIELSFLQSVRDHRAVALGQEEKEIKDDTEESNNKRILLFVRPSSKFKYIFCGQGDCDGVHQRQIQSGDIVEIILNIFDSEQFASYECQDDELLAYLQLVNGRD